MKTNLFVSVRFNRLISHFQFKAKLVPKTTACTSVFFSLLFTQEFSVWAISSSPLIVATDIRNMTAVMQQCLLNAEAIGINQDYQSPSGGCG